MRDLRGRCTKVATAPARDPRDSCVRLAQSEDVGYRLCCRSAASMRCLNHATTSAQYASAMSPYLAT
jgi:hypothetical protein